MRNIKNETAKVTKADKSGIISLYETLVSRTMIANIDVNRIREEFPTFEDVDFDMIVEQAFPAFERTIGVENFEKVKKHFGIGYRKSFFSKNKKQSKEIDVLVARLRTIENAQYYISGYKELVSKVARKLEGAPKNLTEIEKAKLVRMYYLIFTGGHYFCEDYTYADMFKKSVKIDYDRVFVNNKYEVLPEELFVLYASKISNIMDENIFYDFIYTETMMLDKKLLKEVLKISELKLDENRNFVSVNEPYAELTFGILRNLKMKVNPELGVYPIEMFSIKSMLQRIEFQELYRMYKVAKIFELSELQTVERTDKRIEGSRIIETTCTSYKLAKGAVISGECEKQRFIRFLEYIADRGFSVFTSYDINGKEKKEKCTYNAKLFMSAIIFANQARYLSAASSVERDIEVALKFIEMDKTNALEEYYDCEYDSTSVEIMKERLGIDEKFEFEFFGIKKKIDVNEVITKFAVEHGYAESKEQIDYSLVQAVIIPGNEEIIERYGEGQMDADKFANKIGFAKEFGEMFFNLSKIDMEEIEYKLLEIKKSTKKIDHNLKLLVLLYCYIVEEQIACGPKKRVPKRNKALKPSNLKMFIS